MQQMSRDPDLFNSQKEDSSISHTATSPLQELPQLVNLVPFTLDWLGILSKAMLFSQILDISLLFFSIAMHTQGK